MTTNHNVASRTDPAQGATWQSPPPVRPRRWEWLLSQRVAGALLLMSLLLLVAVPLAFGAAQPNGEDEKQPPPPGALPSQTMCGPDDPHRHLPPCQLPGNRSTTVPPSSEPGLTVPSPPPIESLPPFDPLDPPSTNTCIPLHPGYCDDPDTTTARPSEPAEPCTGEDCLPDTNGPGDGDGPAPHKQKPTEPPDECGISDIGACITEGIDALFRGIVESALNPLLEFLSDTLLTTPTLDDLPQVGPLWQNSWQILLAAYTTLVLVGGLIVMGHETLQTRYGIKEIAPRIVVGFLAAFLSLFVADKLIRLANGLSGALLGGGLDAGSAGQALRDMVMGALTGGGIFLLLMGLALAVMLVALLITYILRVAITVILLIGAPLLLMFHALPQTEGIARWWWRALGGVLAIQVVQSLTLIVALKVFFEPSGWTPFGPKPSGLVNLLVALALIYILLKIPSWILSATRIGGGGRSFAGSLVRGFLAYKSFGLLSGRAASGATSTRAATAAHAGSTASPRAGGSRAASPTASPRVPPPRGLPPRPTNPPRPPRSTGPVAAPPIEATPWGRGQTPHSSDSAHQPSQPDQGRRPWPRTSRPTAPTTDRAIDRPGAAQRARAAAARAWRPITHSGGTTGSRPAPASAAVLAPPIESTGWGGTRRQTGPVPAPPISAGTSHSGRSAPAGRAARVGDRASERVAARTPQPILTRTGAPPATPGARRQPPPVVFREPSPAEVARPPHRTPRPAQPRAPHRHGGNRR